MAAVNKCIVGKGESGSVDKAKADDIAEEFRQNVRDAVDDSNISPEEAEILVARRMQDTAERDKARKKRMQLNQIKVQTSIRKLAEEAERLGVPVRRAMMSRLVNDPFERAISPIDLNSRIDRVRSELQSFMAEFMEEFRSRNVGLTQRTAGIEDVVLEMAGRDTGNVAAKEFAQGVMHMLERGRQRFNAAGGDIIKREDFTFFQVHDKRRVAAAGEDAWVDIVFRLVDRDKMLNVNGIRMSDRQLRFTLRESHKEITSGGLYGDNGGLTPKGFGSSVNKRAESRFINFKTPEAWIEYQKQFGRGSLYEHITAASAAMGRDIAILEVLGPYPEATLRFMDSLSSNSQALRASKVNSPAEVKKLAKEKNITLAKASVILGKKAADASARATNPSNELTTLYNHITGISAIPAGTGRLAVGSQMNRNLVIASTLGSAFLSALGDIPLAGITSRMNGVPVTKVMARYLKLFAANSTEDRLLAVRLGFGAQGWANRAIGMQRIMGEVVGPEWSERVSDTVMRASLLSPHTESMRYAFQIEFLAHITGEAGKTFDQISEPLRKSFLRHGISAKDWDVMRATALWKDEASGATFLRPDDIAGGKFEGEGFDAANKLQQAIFNEMEFAVVASTPQARALLLGNTQSDTFLGEVLRNTALFKGFPVSVMLQHWGRAYAQQGAKAKGQYVAMLLLTMTSMGALAEQLNGIASGRDPEDMSPTNINFWMRALVRGGAGGLVGDTLFRDQNRWGGSLGETLAGPVFGQVDDITRLTVGNFKDLLSGDDTSVGRDLVRFIKKNAPGRSTWYLKAAIERMAFDQLELLVDSKTNRAFRDIERRAKADHDQTYFWGRGDFTPDDFPHFP